MSLMMTVSQMTREGHHGQVGGRAPATLAVNRGLFLGAPRPVEGHRRQWPSWPSIISYPVPLIHYLSNVFVRKKDYWTLTFDVSKVFVS